jgi:hypothetical protein
MDATLERICKMWAKSLDTPLALPDAEVEADSKRRREGIDDFQLAGSNVLVRSFIFMSFLVVFFLFPVPDVLVCTVRRAIIGAEKVESSGSRAGLLLVLEAMLNCEWIRQHERVRLREFEVVGVPAKQNQRTFFFFCDSIHI